MSLIDAFYKDIVQIQPFVRAGSGKPIYGTTETRNCRFEVGANLETTYKTPSGAIEQVRAKAKMFCSGDTIPDKSIVTFEETDYTVISCRQKKGFRASHLEVYLE